jgi:hypothetical protein
MNGIKCRIGLAAAVGLVAGCAAGALGQFIGNTPSRMLSKAPPVQYVYPEQVHLPAGKASTVALHFRVIEGMHINSNKPHDDFLIPTTFSIPTGNGVRLESTNYPAGSDITLPSVPSMKLNVYSGEFVVQTRMVAAAGNHLIKGTLHFQACNMSQCLPPQTITAAIDVVAK